MSMNEYQRVVCFVLSPTSIAVAGFALTVYVYCISSASLPCYISFTFHLCVFGYLQQSPQCTRHPRSCRRSQRMLLRPITTTTTRPVSDSGSLLMFMLEIFKSFIDTPYDVV